MRALTQRRVRVESISDVPCSSASKRCVWSTAAYAGRADHPRVQEDSDASARGSTAARGRGRGRGAPRERAELVMTASGPMAQGPGGQRELLRLRTPVDNLTAKSFGAKPVYAAGAGVMNNAASGGAGGGGGSGNGGARDAGQGGGEYYGGGYSGGADGQFADADDSDFEQSDSEGPVTYLTNLGRGDEMGPIHLPKDPSVLKRDDERKASRRLERTAGGGELPMHRLRVLTSLQRL